MEAQPPRAADIIWYPEAQKGNFIIRIKSLMFIKPSRLSYIQMECLPLK